MNKKDVEKYIQDMPDEVLEKIQFSMPWQYDVLDKDYKDPDGFDTTSVLTQKEDAPLTRAALQLMCWNKFQRNPQINTSVRGLVGRMTGMGFEATSEIPTIQNAITEIELDPRNRLYSFWPQYVGRSLIEGELYLALTCHPNGFIEVDFIDPGNLSKGGDEDTAIIFHPNKTNLPLFYIISSSKSADTQIIPSIYIARYPELISLGTNHPHFHEKYAKKAKSRKKIFKKWGNYFRFVVNWDKGFVTKRNISYLRTTLEWLNHYENLKKFEIDHKKSAGAYLWVVKITDARSFKLWLSMTDEERRKTGIMAKKTPGGTLVLPPGMEIVCINPNLTSIKEQDTDILHMVASGLNEPVDIMTGASSGPFASVKATRGPMSDRVSDEIAYLDRFFKYDFWASVFFLKSELIGFPKLFEVREAVRFEDQEPVIKPVKKPPEQLIDIAYPISEIVDLEARSKAVLGVKHGPLADSLGIPNKKIAELLGFGGYGRGRLRKATEDEKYPELVFAVDAEMLQEQSLEPKGAGPSTAKKKTNEVKPKATQPKKETKK